ncbi:MAG TPA: RnfH family protein [Ramlibacter sp.]|nr:RnfH family protein [Ramlibacter sp.]
MMHVTVAWSPEPRDVRERQLELPPGSTVADAIAASGVAAQGLTIGIWGRKAGLAQLLRDRDRVELYRPLKVDPKVARRERFRRQGTKVAGLFARKKD